MNIKIWLVCCITCKSIWTDDTYYPSKRYSHTDCLKYEQQQTKPPSYMPLYKVRYVAQQRTTKTRDQ